MDKRRKYLNKIGHASVRYKDTSNILVKTSGFLSAYDYTLNPYVGCTFACTYCYAASFVDTDEDRDNWGYWVQVKQNAVDKMARRRKNFIDDKIIYMSSATDPYQPIEKKLELTRGILETIVEKGFTPKLVVQTRSPYVVRDCDLYREIERNGGQVRINMTITTDDEDVRKVFEPHCPSNKIRMKAISKVHQEGLDTCITMAPLLLLEDTEQFADDLLRTGVPNFIIQPFHYNRSIFAANTREGALDLMSKKLNCSEEDVQFRYLQQYNDTFEILNKKLPNLGEGKNGFMPPFNKG